MARFAATTRGDTSPGRPAAKGAPAMQIGREAFSEELYQSSVGLRETVSVLSAPGRAGIN